MGPEITPEILKPTREMVVEYGPLVSALCHRMIRDQDLAADAAQESWYQILKALPRFRHESQVSTWIYGVVVRVVRRFAQKERIYSVRFLRSVFHEDKLVSPYSDLESSKLFAREECDRCLTGVLHCLDTDSRLVYLFREVAELSWKEISLIMGCGEDSVRQTGSRAIRKLRRFLNEECVLFNPEGSCSCRMSQVVRQVDLPAEMQRIRGVVGKVRILRELDQVLPKRNFWVSFVTN